LDPDAPDSLHEPSRPPAETAARAPRAPRRASALLGVALALAALGCSSRPDPAPPGEPQGAPAAVVEPPAAAPAVVPDVAPPPAEPVPAGPPEEAGARELQPGEEVNGDGVHETELAPADPADPAALLHEAMDAYESAAEFWEQGAADDAYDALDHAYERMLQVPGEGDAVVAQEKENLRYLISRRVVEINASRQGAVGDTDGEIPRVLNDDVRREISSFSNGERQFFLEAYRRSGLYRPMIVAQLKAAGMPESLSWLPLVESGFKDRALSRARALGLWQFIPSTGYRYGLDRSDWIDERMDPEKSTQAALAYLTALHNLFGDWLTALAAYNCGERAVLRQIQSQSLGYFDQFWDLYERLPRETRRYVPRFLAVLEILDDPRKYGFDELPEPSPALEYETVEVARSAQLEAIDRAMSLDVGTLARLNPELRRNGTPSTTYALKVPKGAGERVQAQIASLPSYKPPRDTTALGTHRVRSGETLSEIADRYRTSVRELMRLNRLRNANRLSPGQRLNVPERGGGGSSDRVASSGGGASRPAPGTPVASIAPGDSVQHRVRSGESLWLLASRYGTTVEQIRRDNGLSSSRLRPGQVLTIRSSTSAQGGG
jgi:membrane-bound lytic murein transglycosylase D